jgi:DUF4097 and DUF4098 domain-containing protein YvlB
MNPEQKEKLAVRTFDTPGPISATIEVIAGDIKIIATGRTDTVVTVQPRNPGHDLDVRTAEQTRVEFSGDHLLVKSPKPLQVYFGPWSAAVDVVVELPSFSSVKATTAQGDLRGDGRFAGCEMRTYDGDIAVQEAADLKLRTLNGTISADRVTGNAHVTGSGDVQLVEVDGDAYVKNLNGPSWIGRAGGEVAVNSAHGDITIDRAGPKVVARTADGDVRLGEVSRGTVSLRTASGAVEVGVRRGTAAWLDVRSSSGEVRTELESTGDVVPTGDTAQITARTWAGDITVFRAV